MPVSRRIRKKMQRRGCGNKHRHSSREAAEKQLIALKIRERKKPGLARSGVLQVYHCSFCGNWHVGRKKTRYSLADYIDRVAEMDRKKKGQC